MMPQLGETVTEGTITRWMKAVGDAVERDEPLFEVSTDKVDSEVPSPAAGVLTEILVPEGETVEVGVKLAVIGDGAGSAAPGGTSGRRQPRSRCAAPAPAEPAPPPPPLHRRPPARRHRHHRRSGSARQAPAAPRRSPSRTARRGTVVLSPMVRKLLAENGISETEVTGTGSGGRITREDALRVVDARRASGAAARRTDRGPAPAHRQHPRRPHPRPSPPAPRRAQRAGRRRPSPWRRSAPPATRSCRSRTCAGAPPSTWCARRRRHPTRSSPTRSTSRASSACARPGVSASRPRRASR